MKKFLRNFLVLAVMAMTACVSVACSKSIITIDNESNIVYFYVDENIDDGTTLLDYMQKLTQDDKFYFEIKDGMITEICGIKSGTNKYWMLYTDDLENSNESWGVISYQEKNYYSAIFGAENLTIKSGCAYIWFLQEF